MAHFSVFICLFVYLLLTATQYTACHPMDQKSQSLGDIFRHWVTFMSPSCNVKRCSVFGFLAECNKFGYRPWFTGSPPKDRYQSHPNRELCHFAMGPVKDRQCASRRSGVALMFFWRLVRRLPRSCGRSSHSKPGASLP